MSNMTAHLSIGDFARATGLSAKALRLYDEMGLLVPAEVDAFTEPGDRLVLTTDGVHGRVDPAALAGLLLTEASADDVAGAVADVVEAAGADDNYAVLVVDLS